MSDLRTAAQQALEALEEVKHKIDSYQVNVCDDVDEAITALRAALEQQAEPAWCDCEPTQCSGVGRCRWHALGYSPLAHQAEPTITLSELQAALGWPGGISSPVSDKEELLRMVAERRAEPRTAELNAWARDRLARHGITLDDDDGNPSF